MATPSTQRPALRKTLSEKEKARTERGRSAEREKEGHHHRSHSKGARRSSRRRSHHDGNDEKDSEEKEPRRARRSSQRHHHRESKAHVDLTEDEVQEIAERHTHRSEHCSPEILKEFAQNGPPRDYDKDGPRNFRVVAGDEARSIYQEVLKHDDEIRKQLATTSRREITPPAHYKHDVVFAFPAHTQEALRAGGRKLVDYYMTWRGKTGTHRLKGRTRKNDFLDKEFLKIADSLDGLEKKRLSTFLDAPPSGLSARPPITLSYSSPPAFGHRADVLDVPKPARYSADDRHSNASALSLPLLGPSLPLRLTNPDPASSSGAGAYVAWAPGVTTHWSIESHRASLVVDTKRKKHDLPLTHSPLKPVVEGKEEESRKDRRSRPRRSEIKHNESSESPSRSSSSYGKDEILIVLMDSDHENRLMGDHSRVRRNLPGRLPTRRTSTRRSPWNSPAAATTEQSTHAYGHGYRGRSFEEIQDPYQYSSESEDEDPYPSIPIKAELGALGYRHHNHSSPTLAPNSQNHSPQGPPPSLVHPTRASYPPYALPTPFTPQRSLPALHNAPNFSTPRSLHHVLPPVTYTPTLQTPYSMHQALPFASYISPYALSTPSLPAVVGVSPSPNSSYHTPWSTPMPPLPGGLPQEEHPAAYVQSPYIPPPEAPWPFPTQPTPLKSTIALSAGMSPYVGGTGNEERTVPLPHLSSPFMGGTS